MRRAFMVSSAAALSLSLVAGALQDQPGPATSRTDDAAAEATAVVIHSPTDGLLVASAPTLGDSFAMSSSSALVTKAAKKSTKKSKKKKPKKSSKKSKKSGKKSKKSKKSNKKKSKKSNKKAKKSKKKSKKKAKKSAYRGSGSIRSVPGRGAKGKLKGTTVDRLAVKYLRSLGARNVTLKWNLSCPTVSGMIFTRGQVSSLDSRTIRLCVSGRFDSAYARNSLRFLVAHEYAHILQNRAFGVGRSATYQSIAKTEKQADCAAAAATRLSVRTYGSYTGTCSGKLAATARQLIAGKKPASLGR